MAVNIESPHWPDMSEFEAVDRRLTEELNTLPVLSPDTFTARQMAMLRFEAADNNTRVTANHFSITIKGIEKAHVRILEAARLSDTNIAAGLNIACHSGLIEYDALPPEDVPSPEEALFLKCAALGWWRQKLDTETGLELSRTEVAQIKARMGVRTPPGLVMRCYQQSLFVPHQQLAVEAL